VQPKTEKRPYLAGFLINYKHIAWSDKRCVHRVESLLKRWILGTHQGAISPEHLDYYLDEFTFRFNRRTSQDRGKLFYRLIQHAMAIGPVQYGDIIKHVRGPKKQNHNI
jgi:hypothetical protein